MARTANHLMSIMVILGILLMLSLDITVAQIGVCYGRNGDNLPPPNEVVALFNQYNIRRMRIYDPHPPTLQALRGSNIELLVGVLNPDLQYLAASQANADTWVQNNIKNYPDVRFRYIIVGNEVRPDRPDTAQYVQFVLPALTNVHNAISAAGLGNQIRVSTSVDTEVLQPGTSYPPNNAVFKPVVTPYLNPIISFLANTARAPLLANIYPYFAYIKNQAQIDLGYALFTSDGVVMPDGTRYQNLFYALVDAMYAALEKSGGSNVELMASETGWPTPPGHPRSVENAKTYNANLIQRVKSGTPKRPGRAIETYIFAMFDENQKSSEDEKTFGLFSPNKQLKYPIDFN